MQDGSVSAIHSIAAALESTDEYLGRLETLPDTETLRNRLADDLWAGLLDNDNQSPLVQYGTLADAGRSVIGVIEDDEDMRLPWWFHAFDWEVTYAADTIQLDSVADLERFEQFDATRTEVHRPTAPEADSGSRYHMKEAGLLGIHESLLKLREELRGEPDDDSTADSLALPASLFEVGEARIELTDAFDEWVTQYLQLLPGVGPTATALLFAQTNTEAETAREVLSSELVTAVENAGLVGEKLYNESITDALLGTLNQSRVLDRTFPVPNEYDSLSGLKYNLYAAFAASTELTDIQEDYLSKAARSNPPKLKTGENGTFTRAAFGTPLIRRQKRPTLVTEGLYSVNTSGKDGYKDYNNQLRTIHRIFRDQNLN